ncbi:MAG: septation protein SpoVG family protein [Candidatus Hodarchaeota archaeon]
MEEDEMDSIRISDIQVVPVQPREGLVAFASFVINDSIYIGDVAIHTCLSNSEGYRLVYPQRILFNGNKVNCVHPINRKTGDKIQKAVVAKYRNLMSKGLRK